MALLKVITVLATITIAATETIDSYRQIPSKFLEVPDYATQNGGDAPQLSLTLQIPREEDPIPFDTYIVPSTDLRAPEDYSFQGQDAYYPAPSQDLQVPSAQAWNPENDPALLYELPIEITKEILPTNQHPKKYDKAVFDKVKPVSHKPKEEVVLVPIKVQDYINKQKQQDKAILNFAKLENQKLIKAEKAQQAV